MDDDDRDAVSAGRGERLVVVARRRLDARVRHGAHREPIEDPRRPADVIALRMRQDDRRERPHAEPAELARDVRLRRALVHEDSTAGGLDERGIPLPDVEEGDAEAARRRPGR